MELLQKQEDGSAPSFYVNKLLGFTNIDRIAAPIKLFPSRFMSVSRILGSKSLPDIDYNCADTLPFYESSKELLGDDGCYWMIAYKPLQVSSGFRLWCKAQGLNIGEYNDVAMDLAELSKVKKPYTESEYYKDEKWKKLMDDSQCFVGAIESVAQHPCSTLLLDKPISEEVGLIKAGNIICANITSYESDNYKYLKNDLLTVTVWDIINKVCNLANIKTPSIRELDNLLDEKTYNVYANGLTSIINQADSDYATGLVKRYKPKSVAEMSAFVAVIRPGCASLLQDFIDRKPHTTNVPELDHILKDGQQRMLFQELLMSYLIWLGIPEDDSYDVIKKIAKKKFKEEELKELKDRLKKQWIAKIGSDNYFEENWQVVQDAARYSFNCLAGDTRIQRLGQKSNAFNPTIEEMYLIKNDYEYAKKTGHLALHGKYNWQGYGNALSMFDDKKIYQNKIVDIYFTGKQKIYRVKTSSGCYVDCTMNHSFPTPTGKKKLEELSIGDELYIKGARHRHLVECSFIEEISTKIDKIISIEYLREDNVYDIEMESPAHNFISESGLVVSNCSHSLAYAYDSLYMAYLKSHYPLEFYTVALNFYQGDFDRTKKLTEELEYWNLKLSSPKFNYASGAYTCDKSTNTIYKGTSSIKGLSKKAGTILYNLKDNQYSNFYSLLKDMLENGIGLADITVLTQLDFFSEFGKMKKLLKFIDIYKELGGKKTIKKDKEYLVKQLVLKEFCQKETEKQYSGFDSDKCLNYLFDKIPDEDEDMLQKCEYELKYYGYIGSVFADIDNKIYAVLDLVLRGKNRIANVQQLCTGEKKNLKIKAPDFNAEPFDKGAILKIKFIAQENKWVFDKTTNKCVKSLTTFEDVLKEYEVI